MKRLHFEGLDLYKGDKLQGYIEENESPKNSHDKYIFWVCPEGAKGVNEIDLHYYEKTLDATKKSIIEDYETSESN